MDNNECSYKMVSAEDIHRTEYAHNSSAGEVYMSKEKAEYIKKLMFSALEDPRAKYTPITIDEMTDKWDSVEKVIDKTKDSN